MDMRVCSFKGMNPWLYRQRRWCHGSASLCKAVLRLRFFSAVNCELSAAVIRAVIFDLE